MFQTSVHKFTFTNTCNIPIPLKWTLDDTKRRRVTLATTPSKRSLTPGKDSTPLNIPFYISPAHAIVAPNSSHTFELRFLPTDACEFVYLLKGETPTGDSVALATDPHSEPSLPHDRVTNGTENGNSSTSNNSPIWPIRMVLRGQGKRPICHFELEETTDYLTRRPLNLKNENGLQSPIEAADLRVVEVESCGLRSRNTFRFHIINPTADNFEFLWESVGDPSPFWRCVQSSGMLFGGKRIEIVFEYLPEDIAVAESFFEFKLPKVKLAVLFL